MGDMSKCSLDMAGGAFETEYLHDSLGSVRQVIDIDCDADKPCAGWSKGMKRNNLNL